MTPGGFKDEGLAGFWQKLGLVARTILVRGALLLFYLVFIILFIGFQVTGKGHVRDVMETLVFRNRFFNSSVVVFLINMVVQLISGFFISGKYRTEAPRAFASFFGGRTVLIHVMLVGSVFIHQYFFQGRSYEAEGEVAYIGIFMLIKTIGDIGHLREEPEVAAESPPMT